MTPKPFHGSIVLGTVLSLVTGCEVLAPLQPLPGQGHDAGAAGEAGTAPDGGDGGTPVVVCDPSMPFGEAVPVHGLNRNPGTEWRLTLMPDELTAYVSAASDQTVADLYVSKRADELQPFGELVALTEVNSSAAELSVSVSGDGLKLFFDSNRSLGQKIYMASRATVDEPFGSPNEFPLPMPPIFGDAFDPYILPDGTALYFTSVDEPSLVRLALDGELAGAVGIVSEVKDARLPVVSQDQLTLYFAGDSPTTGVWGSIFIMTRPSRDVVYGVPTAVSELNTGDVQYPQWISPDGCRLYFSRAPDVSKRPYSFVAERMHN